MEYSQAALIMIIALLVIVIKLQFELGQRVAFLFTRIEPLVQKIEQFAPGSAGDAEPPTYIQQVLGNFLMNRMQQENDQAQVLTRAVDGSFSKE